MVDPDVPSNEMRWFRSSSDPIDALFGDDPMCGDVADLVEICHELRSAYLPTEPLRRSRALAAFTHAPLDDKGDLPVTAGSNAHGSAPQTAGLPNLRESLGRRRQKMLNAMSAFVATVMGKVALGTAVAAASVGGLHAAGAVDVPGLPDNDPPAVEQEVENADDGDLPEEAVAGQETSEAKREAAAAYTEAVREWDDCLSQHAAAQGDESTRTTDGSDPRDDCGIRPDPADFDLTSSPDNAADEGQSHADEGRSHPNDDPTSSGSTAPTSDPTGNDPTSSGSTAPTSDPTGNDPTSSGSTAPTSDPTGNDPTSSGSTAPTSDPTGNDPTSSGSTAPTGDPTGSDPTSGGSTAPTSDPSGTDSTSSGSIAPTATRP